MSASFQKPWSPGERLAELDGMRGLAALAVVVAHYFGEVPSGHPNLQFGWLGVEVFFVLSGFLIGGMILDERDRPGFWTSFFVRRAARILPLYGVAVALVCALGAAFHPLVYLTFTQNIAAAVAGVNDTVVAQPLWTLAVEEQFYLLLPLAVVLTPRRWLTPLLVGLVVAGPVFRALVLADNPVAATITLPARMDMLAAGVLAARLLRTTDLSRWMLALRIAPIPLLFTTSGLFFLVGLEAFTVIGQTTLALGVAAFILALALGAPEGRGLFGATMLRRAGTISYGLYLLHQPVNGALHRAVFGAEPDIATAAQLALTGAAVVVSIALSILSWRAFERPIIEAAKTWLARRRTAAVAPAAALPGDVRP